MADYRTQLFYSFSSMLSSGVPLLRVFNVAAGSAPFRWKKVLRGIEKRISSGGEFSEAMSLYPRCFSEMDVRMVRIGEDTGQLAEIFKNLSEWYQSQNEIRRLILSGLAYPIFLLHAAAFIAPLPGAILGGGVSAYLPQMFFILSMLYVPLFLYFSLRLLLPRKGAVKRGIDEFFLAVPILSRTLKNLAMSRYCLAFSMMYKAGIPILKCAKDAPEICGNLAVAARLQGGYVAAKEGNAMSLGFSKSLDHEFRELWLVGEESGNLDAATEKLAQQYLEKARFNFQMISRLMPVVVYLIVAGYIGYLIIRGYQQLYGQMNSFFDTF